MMIIAAILGLVATVAATVKGAQAWGALAAAGIFFGLLVVLLVVPFGALVTAIAGVAVYQRALTRCMERSLEAASPVDVDAFD